MTQDWNLGVKGVKVTTTLNDSRFDSRSERVKTYNHLV